MTALTLGVIWYVFNYVLKSMAFGLIGSFSPVSAIFYNLMLFLAVVGLGTYYSRGKKMVERLVYLALTIMGSALIWAQLRYGVLNGTL